MNNIILFKVLFTILVTFYYIYKGGFYSRIREREYYELLLRLILKEGRKRRRKISFISFS